MTIGKDPLGKSLLSKFNLIVAVSSGDRQIENKDISFCLWPCYVGNYSRFVFTL